MRLGQLARKYNISIQEIISYLDKTEQSYDSHHPNSKLDEETESLVENHFKDVLTVPPDPVDVIDKKEPEQIIKDPAESEEPKIKVKELKVVSEELKVEVKEPKIEVKELKVEAVEIEETLEVAESEIIFPKEELELPEETVELPEKQVFMDVTEVEVQVDQEETNDSIDTDQLLELMESEETSVDLSKIKLIKAPKKELSGLKVVGKIDLPEPKIKDIEKSEEEEIASKPYRDDRNEPRKISQEEREQRRINAKRKKEEYELRQERRNKEKEKKQRKAKKETHYKKQLQKANSNRSTNKIKSKKRKGSAELENQIPKPTTLLGRFLRWLNT
jgi:hypothetical protein